jgi:hypothetical protein
MAKGEYTGADGRTYRWVRADDGFYHGEMVQECQIPFREPIRFADIDAAFAALKELQEEGEWVELGRVCGIPQRINRDGTQTQFRWPPKDGPWKPASFPKDVHFESYRAGRTTGLEDGRKEAEELAEAVAQPGRVSEPTNERPTYVVSKVWFERVVALARKVRGTP